MKRNEQYQAKLDYITSNINNFPNIDRKNQSTMDALHTQIQNSISASMEVIEMLSEDLDLKKGDIYSNLDEMLRMNIFTPEFVKDIRQLNAMRFLLNNNFGNIQEDLIEDQKRVVRKILNEFVVKVKMILDEHIPHIE